MASVSGAEGILMPAHPQRRKEKYNRKASYRRSIYGIVQA
jgi:hypothetical protein